MAVNTDYVIRTGMYEPASHDIQSVQTENVQKEALERYNKMKVCF